MAVCYRTLKNLGLPSYSSQLLVTPLPIRVLCPEYTSVVAPALTHIYFTTNVVFDFKGVCLKSDGRWSNLGTIFGFSKDMSM